MVEKITNKTYDELMDNNEFVVIDFWAEWCAPCRNIIPTLDTLAKNNTDILVGKVNIDEEPELASNFGIRSIPTVIFFKGGEIQDKILGVVPLEKYQNAINAMKGV